MVLGVMAQRRLFLAALLLTLAVAEVLITLVLQIVAAQVARAAVATAVDLVQAPLLLHLGQPILVAVAAA